MAGSGVGRSPPFPFSEHSDQRPTIQRNPIVSSVASASTAKALAVMNPVPTVVSVPSLIAMVRKLSATHSKLPRIAICSA